MGPRGGPGVACPDLTIARITLPVSTFFTTFAALEIFDILICLENLKSASESTENTSTGKKKNREGKETNKLGFQAYTIATNHSHGGLIKTSHTQVDLNTHRQNACLSTLRRGKQLKKYFPSIVTAKSWFPAAVWNQQSEMLALLKKTKTPVFHLRFRWAIAELSASTAAKGRYEERGWKCNLYVRNQREVGFFLWPLSAFVKLGVN